ncbi:HAD family hydrolase [Clostridium sp. C105KSO13]|uniref:HAD family hydrolase n=1 Tax=Clostridium sp. C105KSO13 TaxID=1776045 RepID=UPI0007406F5F|nr:HAD-IA family hydrolase [Clostridium sp. C105KSO13]CUX34119.1 Phosphoglycolate phosphatase [Clostridium sp. C105KSO13]
MYKACIFDLDGTLTDTLDSLAFSVNATLEEMRLPLITREECRRFVGNGARVLMEKALRAGGDDTLERIDEAMEIYGRIFDANCTYHVAAYEGITEMLRQLKDLGLRLAVLSNKPDPQAVHVVEEIFGKETFQWIQGQKPGVPRKPDPAAVLHIAKELGAQPKEAIYIGDSEVDIATGTAAKMKTIGVSWGFRGREDLKADGAGIIVDIPGEITEWISKNQEVENHG